MSRQHKHPDFSKTVGKRKMYSYAMYITDQAEADVYLSEMVAYCKPRLGLSYIGTREYLIGDLRANSYYYDRKTVERVASLFYKDTPRSGYEARATLAISSLPRPEPTMYFVNLGGYR